jgi:hypothetical protein
MTTMPQAMPRAMLGALHQASRKHHLRHAPRNAWRNARRYARTYERTYLRTLFKPWVDLSRNVSRAKCATIHPCPGAEATLRARLTDRHRPCRQAVDELSALVTAERDRQRQARLDLIDVDLDVDRCGTDLGWVTLRIREIADDLDGPAEPTVADELREQLNAERERARQASRDLDNLTDWANGGRATPDIVECICRIADYLDGPAPNPLTSPNPSGPPVTPDPSWIDCGTPTCTSCWLQRHEGHDVGMRHEDGALHSATCHDCGARHNPHLSNPQAPTNPSADHHG